MESILLEFIQIKTFIFAIRSANFVALIRIKTRHRTKSAIFLARQQ